MAQDTDLNLTNRLERLEKLMALGNLLGPDPTSYPEASAEFSELLKDLRRDAGLSNINKDQLTFTSQVEFAL